MCLCYVMYDERDDTFGMMIALLSARGLLLYNEMLTVKVWLKKMRS